jgi:hypothetical protein
MVLSSKADHLAVVVVMIVVPPVGKAAKGSKK